MEESIQLLHHKRQGCREGRKGRRNNTARKKKTDSRDRRREEKREEEAGVGRKNTDARGSTVWYNLPLSIFSIIHYLFT